MDKEAQSTYYGYKDHVLCDSKSKLIKHYVVTDAALHDSGAMNELVSQGKVKGQNLYGDSAYRGTAIEQSLKRKRIDSQIHEKGYRNAPLVAVAARSVHKPYRWQDRPPYCGNSNPFSVRLALPLKK